MPVTSRSDSRSLTSLPLELGGRHGLCGLGGWDAVSGRMELMLNDDLRGVRAIGMLNGNSSIFTMVHSETSG